MDKPICYYGFFFGCLYLKNPRNIMPMPQLPVVHARDLIKALKKKCYEQKRQKGSHVILAYECLPPRKPITVPYHDEIKPGTLCAIIEHAELSREEFCVLYYGRSCD